MDVYYVRRWPQIILKIKDYWLLKTHLNDCKIQQKSSTYIWQCARKFYPTKKIWIVPLMLSKKSLKFHRECFPPPDSFWLGLDCSKQTTLTSVNVFILDHTPSSIATSNNSLTPLLPIEDFMYLKRNPFSFCNNYFLLGHLELLSS